MLGQIPRFNVPRLITARLHCNRKCYLSKAVQAAALDAFAFDLLRDPQTSGGLLISVSEKLLPQLEQQLKEQNVLACEIGRVISGEAGVVLR